MCSGFQHQEHGAIVNLNFVLLPAFRNLRRKILLLVARSLRQPLFLSIVHTTIISKSKSSSSTGRERESGEPRRVNLHAPWVMSQVILEGVDRVGRRTWEFDSEFQDLESRVAGRNETAGERTFRSGGPSPSCACVTLTMDYGCYFLLASTTTRMLPHII